MQKLFFNHYAIAAVITISFAACQTYYKANTIQSVSDRVAAIRNIDSLCKTSRYLILRYGNEAFYIKNIVLSNDQKTAQCVLDLLPIEHKLHLTEGLNHNMSYRRSDNANAGVINEVHFYTLEDSPIVAGNYTLHLDKIIKIEVLEHDKNRTSRSYRTGALIIAGGIIAVAGIAQAIVFASAF